MSAPRRPEARPSRLGFDGAVDADGHVLEPPDLWERYLEAGWRERAIRLRRDEQGLEYMEIDRRPSRAVVKGFPGLLGGMGRSREQHKPSPERTYVAGAPFGSMDAGERVALLDTEHLDAALLYPTLSLLWEAECTDAALAQAYCRAYNRWICEFCAGSGGRLFAVAQLSLADPAAAADELARAVGEGARGGWVAPFTLTGKPHGHPDHDRLFAVAQDLDVPLGIHPTFEPTWAASGRFKDLRRAEFLVTVTAGDGVRHALTSFFQFGVFDRFPRLKLVVLESGAGWIGYWLDRMDAVFATPVGRHVPLRDKPSAYFRRQCWISADPDERTIPGMMDVVGADRFFWASDFPHPDHTGDYIAEVERLASRLPDDARGKLLGANVRAAYGL